MLAIMACSVLRRPIAAFNGQIRMRLHGAVKRGECLPIDLLAERPVLGISFFEGVADRPFDRVQTVFPVGNSLQLLIVSRSGGINQRLAVQ